MDAEGMDLLKDEHHIKHLSESSALQVPVVFAGATRSLLLSPSNRPNLKITLRPLRRTGAGAVHGQHARQLGSLWTALGRADLGGAAARPPRTPCGKLATGMG